MKDTEKEIKQLSDLVKKYQDAYFKHSKSLITDEEYDALFSRLSILEKENPSLVLKNSPTKRVGIDLQPTLLKYNHLKEILSLKKAYSQEDIYNFIKRIFLSHSYLKNIVLNCEEKIDGVSIVLYYEDFSLKRALTRGDGKVGNDVSENIKMIKEIPLNFIKIDQIFSSLIIRGEIYIDKEDFYSIKNKSNVLYSNPRNFVSGTIMRKDNSLLSEIPLRFFLHDINFKNYKFSTQKQLFQKIQELGYNISEKDIFKSFSLKSEDFCYEDLNPLIDYIEKKRESRESLKRQIDGIVVKVDDLKLRENLGSTSHHPRWAIAYKFESPKAISTVKNIIIQIGRSGRITPVAVLDEVEFSGSIIKKATLHNQEYINKLNLSIGDLVSITKQGDIIPAVKKVIEKNSEDIFQIPDFCPFCSVKLTNVGEHKFCKNYLCNGRVRARIIFFISKQQMDIMTFGKKTIDFFIQKKIIKDIDDIYKVPISDIKKIIKGEKDYIYIEREKLKNLKKKCIRFKTYEKIYFKKEDFFSFKDKKLDKLKENIKKSLDMPFKKVLLSIGIKDLGERNISLVLNNGIKNINDFKNIDKYKSRLINVEGISLKTIQNIKEEFNNKNFLRLINRLEKIGLNMVNENEFNIEIGNDDNVKYFLNKKWCITGSFSSFESRSVIKKEIEKRGGKVLSAISRNTDYLLLNYSNNKKNSLKLEKALKYNIKIIEEEEFKKYIL